MTLHFVLTEVAGVMAGVGACAMIPALLARADHWRRGWFQTAMVGLGAAGLVLTFGSVSGVLEPDALFHGLLLLVFASGSRLVFPTRA